jgi:hypothetical protein
MKQAIWKARRNSESERSVYEPQRKNIAITAKHFAEQQTADETHEAQHRAGKVRGRK